MNIIITEQVFHRFTLDQLPPDLQAEVRAAYSHPDNDTTDVDEKIDEWFCGLKEPWKEAETFSVHDRQVEIQPDELNDASPKS